MKFTSLIVLIIITFLVSCSKDEPTPAEKLAGQWSSGTININIKVGEMTLSQYLVSTGISPVEALLYTALVNSTVQSYFTGVMQVNSDGTFTWKTSASSASVTGTWYVNEEGTELILSSASGLGGVFEITELTTTKLNLHSLQNLNPALIGSGLPSGTTVDITLSFTRD